MHRMQGASRAMHALVALRRLLQRTHEPGWEARERAPRTAGLHGVQQRHGVSREGGGAADAQRLVEHRVQHAGRQLAAPPDDLLGDRKREWQISVPIPSWLPVDHHRRASCQLSHQAWHLSACCLSRCQCIGQP